MALLDNFVVRLDSVKARKTGHLYSLIAGEEVQNGMVGIAGNLQEGEREVRSFDKPVAAKLNSQRAVLVYQPEIIADESSRANANLKNFSIQAGTIFRAYELHVDDIFSVSDNAIDALDADKGPVVGNYVVMQDGSYVLKEVTGEDIAGHAFVGRIEDIGSIGRPSPFGQPGIIAGGVINFVGIRVIANEAVPVAEEPTTSTTTVNP